jgi:uncharacterized membrane protein YgdD (TMEM256/DUF423 family)
MRFRRTAERGLAAAQDQLTTSGPRRIVDEDRLAHAMSGRRTRMERFFVVLGSLSGCLAVGLGAFAAHGLRARVPGESLATFEVGARYHMYHALALLLVAWASGRWPGSATVWAGWLFVVGTVLFSGSLYLMTATGQRWLGAITPFGGLAFLLGWLSLALAAWKAA